MERQFPKNVRQIGNVSDEPKIYVEDYVDIYLNQLAQQVGEKPAGAMLIGEILSMEGQDVIYVSGAVQIREIELSGTEIVIEEGMQKDAEEKRKKFFQNKETVGWCLIENGQPVRPAREITKAHSKIFSRDNTVFIWKDAMEKEEIYYSFKFGGLMQMGGHYIYYEKNQDMQNYMIATRKKNGVTPCEMVEDRAAKDFRSAVKLKMEEKEHMNSRFVYVTSALLVVVVLAIGVSTVNNFDKMEAVQNSLESLSQSVNKPESQTRTITDEGADTPEGETQDMPEAGGQGDAAPQEDNGGGESDVQAGTIPDTSTIQEQMGKEDYYIVQKGDTLDSISIKMYGDTSHVKAICKMNGLSDGNLIYIGQKLLLP